MNLTKALTPKDTEEIKPGLFIQRRGNNYRQIDPAAWNGKINWKNFLLGQNFLRNFIWFVIIIFLAWSYFYDTKVYRDFYEEVIADPVSFCTNISLINTDEIQITSTLQSNYGESSQIILEG